MKDLTERISKAFTKEENRAERFANTVRFILLAILTLIAVFNAFSITAESNILNFSVLALCYGYGLIVSLLLRRRGYRPIMKYITSSLDIGLVFLLLFMYSTLDIPAIALKNYVFLIVFLLIALTAFRYDRMLTLITGGLVIVLYLGLIGYLLLTHKMTLTNGGYAEELFSKDVTYIGQVTKIGILGGFILLISYLAQYSRTLFAKLITEELSIRSQKETIDTEIRIASQVQMRFLPRSFPTTKNLDIYGAVQQGTLVGGDYFDFIKLNDDTLFLVIADVSGKGVPAALIMAEVRASIQLMASMSLTLEDLAQRLNDLIYQSTDKKNFVTFFGAILDTSTNMMLYINAGHPPPFVLFKGEIRSLGKGTIPLGIAATLPSLSQQQDTFPPGSMIVAYTDGISERSDAEGVLYGEKKFQEFMQKNAHLRAAQFAQHLFDDVSAYGSHSAPDDDATLGIIRYMF